MSHDYSDSISNDSNLNSSGELPQVIIDIGFEGYELRSKNKKSTAKRAAPAPPVVPPAPAALKKAAKATRAVHAPVAPVPVAPVWSKASKPKLPKLNNLRTGSPLNPNQEMENTPSSMFLALLTPALLDHIVTCTNAYAKKHVRFWRHFLVFTAFLSLHISNSALLSSAL